MSDFKLRRFPPVQFLLYLALRAIVLFVDQISYRSAPAVARLVGALMRRIDPKHRQVATDNLAQAGVSLAILPRVYEHFALCLLEMLMLPRFLRAGELERHVSFDDFHHFDAARSRERGVIVVIGHLGNWELAGLASAHAGYPVQALARDIENPWIQRWLLRTRTSTGAGIISKYGAVQAMVESLRRKEILIIQVDQDAKRNGVFVEFFGRPASTHRSAALLALKYDVAIIPANVYRDAAGRHHLVPSEPIEPSAFRGRPEAVRELTQAFTSRLEGFIRQHPEQWNWLHRRWKTEPAPQGAEVEASTSSNG